MTPSPRERLIAGMIALVRERGVAGTGITDLLARSDTARRSIYQNFPRGKAELVEESTRVAGQMMSSVIAGYTATDSPVDSLAAFIQMWKDTLTSSDFTAGCPIVAAALGGPEAPLAPADWRAGHRGTAVVGLSAADRGAPRPGRGGAGHPDRWG
ncbi:TetR/AcrR family transcriptional regulator [Nocardia sp. NPDC055053]